MYVIFRLEKLGDLVDRLQEVQYELTDRLAYFLCAKKPDHRTGQHFIIPELSDRSVINGVNISDNIYLPGMIFFMHLPELRHLDPTQDHFRKIGVPIKNLEPCLWGGGLNFRPSFL